MVKTKAVIHVVDDDRATRKYLTQLISSVGHEVKTYATADEFLENFSDGHVGCIILDIRLPGISGLDLQKELNSRNIDLPVIIISGYGDVSTAVRAMKAGAMDFIEKPFSPQLLLERLQKALEAHQSNRNLSQTRNEILSRLSNLTNREKEVMDLVVTGQQNKDIATTLGISIKTVEVHRANVMEKMAANSIAELVRMAVLAHPENIENK